MAVIVLYASYVLGFVGWAFLLSYLFHDIFWGVTVALAVAAALVLYKLSRKKSAPQEKEQPEETLLDTVKREAVEEREREEMRRAAMAPKDSKKPDASKPDPASGKTE